MKLRRWRKDRKIKLGYRIVGDYPILMSRLSWPIRKGYIRWEPAFDAVATIDVEKIIQKKVDQYAEFTGLTITPERVSDWDDSANYDIVLDIFLSDRTADLAASQGAATLRRRFVEVADLQQSFIPWGWAGAYGRRAEIVGAACQATYSAFTFREEIAADLKERNANDNSRSGPWPPFFAGGGNIRQKQSSLWDGLRGRVAYNPTQRENLAQDTQACRTKLARAYRIRWKKIIEGCLSTALGVPISDIGPLVALREARKYSAIHPLGGLELDNHLGMKDWVALVGTQTKYRYHESDYYRAVSIEPKQFLGSLYQQRLPDTISKNQTEGHTFFPETERKLVEFVAKGSGKNRLNLADEAKACFSKR